MDFWKYYTGVWFRFMIEEIQQLLNVDYKIDLTGLSLDTKLSDLQAQDNSFDSLNRIDFLIQVEKHYGIEIPAEIKITTLQDLINEISQRI